MWPPKTILHPSDFSDNSQEAFELACRMAVTCGSKVLVLHAYAPDIVALREIPPMPVGMESINEAHRMLQKIQSSQPGVVIEHQLVSGTAVEVIVSTALSIKADLIVMGTYGRSGIKRLFLGSVADHVLRRAPCPVLIVPPVQSVENQTDLAGAGKVFAKQTN